MRLSRQIFILTITSVFLSMLIASVYFSIKLRESMTSQKLESLNTQLALRVQSFQTSVQQLKDDTDLLANDALAVNWLTTREPDNNTIEALLTAQYRNILQTRPPYFQLRLLSPEGRELIRLDKSESHDKAPTISVTEKKDLQDKSGRYYVNAVKNVRPGEIWLSPIDLNREHGVISQPETPTLRAAALLTNAENKVIGIVIINMDAGGFLDAISKAPTGSKIFVVNKEGDFLAHPNPAFTFSSDRNTPHTLSVVYPELTWVLQQTQLAENPNQPYVNMPEGKSIFRSQEISYDHINPKNNVRIIHLHPYKDFSNSTNAAIYKYLKYSFLLFVLVCTITLALSRLVSRRFLYLHNTLNAVRHNEKPVIETGIQNDEVDTILLTFKKMLETIDDRELSLIESEKRIQTILNTVLSGMITISKTGEIVSINQYGALIFGYNVEDLIGKKINILMPEEEALLHDSYLEKYRIDGKKRVIGQGRVIHGKRIDGSFFPISLVVSELYLNDELHFVGAIDDISEQLEKEQKISAYSKELEISNRDLEHFAYMASHDLQEPVRKIESFSSLLLMTEAKGLSSEGMEILQRNMRSARRMRELINAVLALSRVGRQALPNIKVDLNKVTALVLEDMQDKISANKASITINELPEVIGDETQLQLLINNLLNNAIKFCDANKVPVVRLYSKNIYSDTEKTQIIKSGFCIVDEGIGIAEEYQKRIFDPFERGQQGKLYEGLGMGLALCRRIVEFHKGEINVESLKPFGTRFTILFPVAA